LRRSKRTNIFWTWQLAEKLTGFIIKKGTPDQTQEISKRNIKDSFTTNG
jgi:hypothetical protein